MTPDKDPHSVLVECTKPLAEYMNKYTDEEFVQMVNRGFEAFEAEMYNRAFGKICGRNAE